MLKTKKIQIIIICILYILVTNIFAQSEASLDERITALEQEIENINKILSTLVLTNDTYNSIPLNNNENINKKLTPMPISTTLASLSYNESNISNNFANYYNDWISYTFTFTNNLEKTIRAAKGTIVFMDVFEEPWWSIELTLNEIIEPGKKINWNGKTDFRLSNESHAIARQTNPSDVVVCFDVDQIIYEDGTKSELE